MISTLTGSSDSKIIQQWNTEHYPVCTGAKVQCSNVYNVAEGKVIAVYHQNKLYSVVVQSNYGECLVYANLSSASVNLNDEIKEKVLIGKAKDYVMFEYCTQWNDPATGIWVMRIGHKTYYKQNPQDILDGVYWPEVTYVPEYKNIADLPVIELTDDQKKEFGNHLGDDEYVEF